MTIILWSLLTVIVSWSTYLFLVQINRNKTILKKQNKTWKSNYILMLDMCTFTLQSVRTSLKKATLYCILKITIISLESKFQRKLDTTALVKQIFMFWLKKWFKSLIALAQQQLCWLYIIQIYPDCNLVITILCSYVEKTVSVSIWIP